MDMDFTWIGIDHVQLAAPAGCEAEARKFFHDILGLPELEKPESLRKRGGVWFQIGVHQIHVGVEADFSPAKKAHPGFAVKNLSVLMDVLESHGYSVVRDELPGVQRFHTTDPFGNRIEFLEYVEISS